MPIFITRWRRSRWGRIAFSLLSIAIIGLTGYYVISKLISSLQQVVLARLVLKPWPIVLSVLITWLCVLSGGLTWYLLLRGVGARAGLRGCTRAHLLANIAGYVPGYGWKYLGKAYMTMQLGVPTGLASLAVFIEFIMLAVTRLAVALSFISDGFWRQVIGREPGALLWLLRALAWGGVILLPWIVSLVLSGKQGRRFKANIVIKPAIFWLVEAMMCLVWGLFGLGFAVLLQSLTALTPSQLVAAIFATTTSYLAGLIVFFVPGGIGVRESVLIFSLAGVLPEAIVALSSILSRAVLIGAELLGALTGLGLRGRREKV